MNWQAAEEEIRKLSKLISNQPRILVGISRGGLVPVRLLSNFLAVPTIYCLTVDKKESNRTVRTKINTNLAGQRVLLVEDVLETGRSLLAAAEYLNTLDAKVETAAIYKAKNSEVKPDYYIAAIDKIPYFPWDTS